MSESPIGRIAAEYGRRGWPVFPVSELVDAWRRAGSVGKHGARKAVFTKTVQ